MPRIPAELAERLSPGRPVKSMGALRQLLVQAGYCAPRAPAVTLELFGSFRMRTGCEMLPLRAGTVGEALEVLTAVFPQTTRLLPSGGDLGEHFRFSINGATVTTDSSQALREGDQLIFFSASVGG